jgi:hypothetical protein
MIATLIFSVILLIITTGILQITRTYYKGITLTNTQNAARTIMDTLAQAIQFNGGQVNWPAAVGGNNAGCIGNQEYSYRLGVQLEATPTVPNQMTRVTDVRDISGCDTGNASFTHKELLSPHMRLTKLNVVPLLGNDNLYEVSVKVVYGDDDLLCSPSVPASCSDPSSNHLATPSDYAKDDITCREQAGSQFCAISSLSTIVQKRMTKT